MANLVQRDGSKGRSPQPSAVKRTAAAPGGEDILFLSNHANKQVSQNELTNQGQRAFQLLLLTLACTTLRLGDSG